MEELIAGISDSSPGSATARLTEWHAKLGNLRLVELRLTRTNQQLHERVKHLEGVVSANETSLSKLEQDLVTITKVHITQQPTRQPCMGGVKYFGGPQEGGIGLAL